MYLEGQIHGEERWKDLPSGIPHGWCGSSVLLLLECSSLPVCQGRWGWFRCLSLFTHVGDLGEALDFGVNQGIKKLIPLAPSL